MAKQLALYTVRQVAVILSLISAFFVTEQLQARELAVERDRLVPMELDTVGINPLAGTPVVLLREPKSGDILPIAVGLLEAQSILRALQGIEEQRPQTHDLFGDVLSATGARLERVIVDELRDNTYMGALEFRIPGQEAPLLLDSRPSDGLALAARSPDVTILVAPEILASINGQENQKPNEQVVTALGVTVVGATRELREALALPSADGVLVSGVSGRAAILGLKVGSLILRVNGDAPKSPMDFLEKIQATPRGELAEIRYWQNDQEAAIELKTGVADETEQSRLML